MTDSLTDSRPWFALGALLVLLLWETLSPFFAFPRGRDRLRHGFLNILLGMINAAVTALAFVALWWWAASFSATHGFGLLQWLRLPTWTEWLIAILLFDAWTYFWHRINHRIPFLWRFHRVHHSDPHMDVTTANRFHIGEIAMSSILRIPPIILLGASIEQLALYEILMFAVVQFHHANISVSEKLDRVLRLFIVTPYMHKVHRSRWQPETDSNYSSLLSIWDRLFHSFRINEKPETIRLGLDEFNRPADQTIPGMLKTPVVNVKQPKGKPTP
jgi:sterol desaturase/sphingolipid hydroxylase (fatty acid hydroxylase superfamily)